jgi:two-component system, sensor histidine kinase and response regulator
VAALEYDKPAPAIILVVDDNEANRALAEATLEDEGYDVVLAASGAEAIEQFSAHAHSGAHPRGGIDCVLLDVRMPELDGFSVCRTLRALPGGADVPVLFLTALRDIDTFDRAMLAGGDDFLTKPVRPTELVTRVRAALQIRRLEAELRGTAAILKEQRVAQKRAQLLAERLTAYIVHDLKSPVNVIDLNAQLLALNGALPDEARASVGEIREAVRRLLRMISNLLDVSKGTEGRLTITFRVVQARAMVEQVVKELSVLAASHGVELTIAAADLTLSADPDLLHRALVNLTENALRHAPAGTAVTLTVAPQGEEIVFSVADRGSGVPEALREAVFEPFVQVDGASPANAGTRGLGLAFCKLVATAHGGSITVSDHAPGAIFALRIPVGHAS